MRRTLILLLLPCTTLLSCRRGQDAPDVSHIDVRMETIRFEREFFSLDTSDILSSYAALSRRHPGFAGIFSEHILGIPAEDSSGLAVMAFRSFLRDYRPIFEETQQSMADLSGMESEIRKGLRHVKHYFPGYGLPTRLYTFIGPLDAYAEGRTGGSGDIILQDGLGIGLQLHLGKDNVLYTGEAGQRLYPLYISRRFEPAYAPVNCMRNIIDDLFPGNPGDATLLEIMVDKGKRMYLLDRFMPDTHDSLKTGYTEAQLQTVERNEGIIWNYFLENDLVYDRDPQRIRPFIGEGPFTQEIGTEVPGHLALYIGRRIVWAFSRRNPEMPLSELLKTDARTILRESGYKPR